MQDFYLLTYFGPTYKVTVKIMPLSDIDRIRPSSYKIAVSVV